MQFKPFFLIVSAVSAVLAASSTISELTDGVSNIDSKLAALENCITAFPKTGGTFEQALNVHNSVDVVVDAVRATVATANGFDGPVSLEDGKEILNYFHGMLPVIESGLNALVEKKDALLGLGVGRARSIISLDLQFLKKAVEDLEIDLIAIAPPGCVAEATDIAAGVKVSLDASISVFSSS